MKKKTLPTIITIFTSFNHISEEEKMKASLQKLHVQRKKWRRHDRNDCVVILHQANVDNIIDGNKL